MRTNFVTPVRVVGDDYKGFAYPVRFVGDGPSPTPDPTPEPIDTKNVFATALTAGGVYIGGTTLTQYNANLDSIYDGFSQATGQWSQSWSDYVSAKGSFDNAMNSCVTADGNIELQTLSDAGFFDSLDSYSAYCVSNGTMATGPSSLGTVTQSFNMYGMTFNTFSSVPWANYFQTYIDQMQASNPSYVHMVSLLIQQNGSNTDYTLYYYDSDRVPVYDNSSYHSMYNNRKTFRYAYIQVNNSGGLNASRSGVSSTSSFDIYDNTKVYDSASNTGFGSYVNPDVTFVNANNPSVTGELVQGQEGLATYDAKVVPSTSTVAPFEPTAEQLAAGYSSSDLVAL